MPKVLIIEEQEKMRKSLVNAFKREGFETCKGTGWENAVEFLKENKYDLVIADLEAKHSAGLDVLKMFKLSDPNAEVVTIVNRNEYNIKDLMSCGMYDCIAKPFLLSDVVSVGKKALEKKQLADKVRNLERIRDMR